MKLSILICTLESRKPMFDRLIAHLDKQMSPEVEVLFSRDNGQCNRGAKRQSLLEQAQGDFIVFRDDDDRIPNDYVPRVLKAITERPDIDCIGYKFACYGYNGQKHRMEPACVSNRYREWKNNVDGFKYVRCPHHLVPVRREHALKVGFDPKLDIGEDAKYSFALRDKRLLKNEAFINEFMYTILHNPTKRPGQ